MSQLQHSWQQQMRTLENAPVGAISSQAGQECPEGSTSRANDPDRIMEPHERAAVVRSSRAETVAYMRSYREKHRERLLVQKREHYRLNRARLLLEKKAYTAKVSAYVVLRRRNLRQTDPIALAKHNSSQARRRKAERRATPAWADLARIEIIYVLAQQLSIETGTKHSVDHIYPLQGKKVCGLHVHDNLRVIPLRENCSKQNREPTDDVL